MPFRIPVTARFGVLKLAWLGFGVLGFTGGNGCGGAGPGVLPDGGDAGGLAGGPDLGAAPDGSTGPRFHYVIDSWVVPQGRADQAFDLNGDGRKDNQLGAVNAYLEQQNTAFNLQNEATSGLITGIALELISFATAAPAGSDDRAAITFRLARTQHSPDLSGTGVFVADKVAPPAGTITGVLASGSFGSPDPKRLVDVAPSMILRIAILGNPADLPLVGAHVTFQAAPDGLMTGQINGAIPQKDFTAVFLPALAAGLDRIAARSPCDADCVQVKKLFDTIFPLDGRITPDDLLQSPLRFLLQPDVDVLTAKGAWLPNPMNSNPNAFSIGVGFSARAATFND